MTGATTRVLVAIAMAMLFAMVPTTPAAACGGFFCQTDPVDQVAERIVFTVNDDETVSSLIEISYVGSAADFSWILPIPEPIGADDVAVPDDGDLVFDELHRLTDVTILEPDPTECVRDALDVQFDMAASAESEDAGGVEVFASGEVGPFGFDVIGAEDPNALLAWLRDNDYRVDRSMEPLIDVYVEEQFSFLAMRLLDGETAESIMPVEVTYPGTEPMIPIRLTAVAAFDEMPVYVWIFADEQAVPANYEHFEIATQELTFSPFGFNDYVPLVQQRADAVGGRGFITEFAGPSDSFSFGDRYLMDRAAEQPYLTRMLTYLDPEEMLVDPVFTFDPSAEDVSNVRNAREFRGLYDCERDLTRFGDFDGSDAYDAQLINVQLRQGTFAGYDDLDPRILVDRNRQVDSTNTSSTDEAATAVDSVSEDDGRSLAEILTYVVLGILVLAAVAYAAFALGRRSPS